MSQYVVGEKVLVTVDQWFYAPNGKSYRAVFGTVKGVRSDAETLGIKTNARATNWYLEVGNTMIAGCQIHYAVKTDKVFFGPTEEISNTNDKEMVSIPCRIYDADQTPKRKPLLSRRARRKLT